MRSRLYLNRWLTFMASCFIQISAGLSYSFSLYAPAVKEAFGYTDTQLAAVGSAFNVGGYLAIPSGYLFDNVEKHKRFGPRLVTWLGALILAAGYLGLAACLGGAIPHASFGLVCLFAVLGGNSSTWFDTASVVTNVRNFPHDRGTVVGILKAFVGLSASVYSSIYAAGFATDTVRYLVFVGTVPPLLAVGLSGLINLVPEAYHEPDPEPKEPAAGISPVASRGAGAGEAGAPRAAVEAAKPGRGGGAAAGEAVRDEEEAVASQRGAVDEASAAGSGLGGASPPSASTSTPTAAARAYAQMSMPPPPQLLPHGDTAAAVGVPQPRRPLVRASTRFSYVYGIVGVVAVYQAGAAIWAGASPEHAQDTTARQRLLAGLGVLLAGLLLVPFGSGDVVHRKPRPDAVERIRRRRFLERLGAAMGGSGTSMLARVSGSFSWVVGGMARSGPQWVRVAGGGGARGAGAPGGPGSPAAIPASRSGAAVPRPTRKGEGLKEPLLPEGPDQGAGDAAAGGAVVVAAVTVQHAATLAAPRVPQEGPPTLTPASTSRAAVPGHARSTQSTRPVGRRTGPSGHAPLDEPSEEEEAEEAAEEQQLDELERVPVLTDVPLGRAARSPLFWLLLVQFSVGLGTGLSLLNNLGSLVVALGGQPGGQVVYVSLFSVANATGRLLGGVLSEAALRRHGTPRTLLLFGASVLTLLGVAGAAMSRIAAAPASPADPASTAASAAVLPGDLYGNLYGTSLLAGFAFGAHWGLVPAITADLFGLQYFGSNYTGLQLGPALGGYVLATLLTGSLADAAARRHGDTGFCRGADCFSASFGVLGALNAGSVVCSQLLWRMTRRHYDHIVRGGGV